MHYTKMTQESVAALNKRLHNEATAGAARPVYHFTPPAMWMNDVNGAIEGNGLRHLFYLHDPFQADGLSEAVMPSGKQVEGKAKPNRVWGHAVTRDWVHWRYLPPVLLPEREKGEIKCISGGSIITADGTPLIMYTTVHENPLLRGQYVAVGDRGLNLFRQSQKNPVIGHDMPGAEKLDDECRDPFLFYQHGQLYCIVAGRFSKKDGEYAGIALYAAQGNDYEKWACAGMLVERPVTETTYFECPKLFQMGEYWVLVYSPFAPPKYMTGMLDAKACRFDVVHEGLIDATDYAYATVNLNGADGNAYLMSWVPGWHFNRQPSANWGGCLSVPRKLSLDANGALVQTPAEEIMALRGAETKASGILKTDAFCLYIDGISEGEQVKLLADEREIWSLRCEGGRMMNADGLCVYDAPCKAMLLWDVCVGELFLDGGRACVTDMEPGDTSRLRIETLGEPRLRLFEMNRGSCVYADEIKF